MAASVPSATDFVNAKRNADGQAQFGWEASGRTAETMNTAMQHRQISHMWLYEWAGGVVTPTPFTVVSHGDQLGNRRLELRVRW